MQEQILIADFMGLYPNPHDKGVTFAKETKIIDGQVYGDKWVVPNYKNSWDWLMPVVEKIQSVERLSAIGMNVNIYNEITEIKCRWGGTVVAIG